MSQQQTPTDFGRIDPDSTVYVHVGDTERSIRQIPDPTPEKTLAFYTRRYENLVAEVTLLVSRVGAQTMSPEEARKAIGTARTNVTGANTVGDLAALTARLDTLEELLPAQIEACKAARAEQDVNTVTVKHAMMNKVEALANGNDWRYGVGRFRELLEEWKALPRVDRTTDSELWHHFNSARIRYMRRCRTHFSELNTRHDEARRLKGQIIAKAAPLVESTDWGPIADTFHGLMVRWRVARSARRADGESLWAKFHTLRDQFFKARSAAQHAVDGKQTENLAARTALLGQTERNLTDVTNVDIAEATLRGFLSKFSETGYVPRAVMQSLDSQVRKLSDRIGELEAERWYRADPEARGRAEGTVALLQSQVDKLTKDLDAAEVAGDARKAKDVRKSLGTYTS